MSVLAIVLLIVGLLIYFILVIFLIVLLVGKKRRYVWSFHGHEIVADLQYCHAILLVDKKIEDELCANGLRFCMLRAAIEGTGIKVRVSYRGLRLEAEAFADGNPLSAQYIGK